MEKKPIRPNFLKEYSLYLTRRCNDRCVFCCDSEQLDGSVRPLDEVVSELRRAAADGYAALGLSGTGEPTLHPDFPRVVEAAKAIGFKEVHVTTNGRRFSSKAFTEAAVKAGLDSIAFSVHGHTAELHDRLSGAPGSFAQSIAGVRNALEHPQLRVHVIAVLNRLNAPHVGEILRYFKPLCRVMIFKQLVPFGLAWSNRDLLFPGEQEGFFTLWELFDRSSDPELRAMARDYLATHVEQTISTVRGGFAGALGGLLERGERPWCEGERCRLCPMQPVCADLNALVREGRLVGRPEDAPCASNPFATAKATPAFLRKGATLDAYLDFFVAHRWRIKAAACRSCGLEASCAGAAVESVLARGLPLPPYGSKPVTSSADGLRRREFGRSGPMVPELGFDAREMNGSSGRGAERAVARALDLGVRFFDTTAAHHENEELLGRALRGRQDAMITTTTLARGAMGKPAPRRLQEAFPAGWLTTCTENSLRKMVRDSLDVQQLHVWKDAWLDDEYWPELLAEIARLKAEGKIRRFGVSLPDGRAESGLRLARSGGVDMVQTAFDDTVTDAAERLFPLCRALGVALVARTPRAASSRGLAARALSLKFQLSFPEVSVATAAMHAPEEADALTRAADGRYLASDSLRKLRARELGAH